MGHPGSRLKRMKVPPGGGSGDTSHDQGVTTDVGCVFDGDTAGKSKAVFSDGQVGPP